MMLPCSYCFLFIVVLFSLFSNWIPISFLSCVCYFALWRTCRVAFHHVFNISHHFHIRVMFRSYFRRIAGLLCSHDFQLCLIMFPVCYCFPIVNILFCVFVTMMWSFRFLAFSFKVHVGFLLWCCAIVFLLVSHCFLCNVLFVLKANRPLDKSIFLDCIIQEVNNAMLSLTLWPSG